MKAFSIVLMYLGFFGLIGFVCWITGSPWPLVALLLTPSYSDTHGDGK